MRSTATNELNELSRVKEIRSEAIHPYSTGIVRKPVDRAYGR
jgi:hypothetical protein